MLPQKEGVKSFQPSRKGNQQQDVSDMMWGSHTENMLEDSSIRWFLLEKIPGSKTGYYVCYWFICMLNIEFCFLFLTIWFKYCWIYSERLCVWWWGVTWRFGSCLASMTYRWCQSQGDIFLAGTAEQWGIWVWHIMKDIILISGEEDDRGGLGIHYLHLLIGFSEILVLCSKLFPLNADLSPAPQ